MTKQNTKGTGVELKSNNQKWLRIIILSSVLLLIFTIAFILAVKKGIIEQDKIFTKYHPLVEHDISILDPKNSMSVETAIDSNEAAQDIDTTTSTLQIDSIAAPAQTSPNRIDSKFFQFPSPDTVEINGRSLFADLVLNSEITNIKLEKIFDSNKNAYPLLLQLTTNAVHQILTEDVSNTSKETLKAIVDSGIINSIKILNRNGFTIFELNNQNEPISTKNNAISIIEIESLLINEMIDQYEIVIPIYHIYGKVGVVILYINRTSVAQ